MPNLLGIDYGTVNIGVSVANTSIAEPVLVLKNNDSVISAIQKLCQQYQITKIIVGVSEGVMAQNSHAFGEKLRRDLNLPVEFYDETLTSREAKEKLQHAKKSLRQKPQDAFQATLMLQDYLDTHTSINV